MQTGILPYVSVTVRPFVSFFPPQTMLLIFFILKGVWVGGARGGEGGGGKQICPMKLNAVHFESDSAHSSRVIPGQFSATEAQDWEASSLQCPVFPLPTSYPRHYRLTLPLKWCVRFSAAPSSLPQLHRWPSVCFDPTTVMSIPVQVRCP